MVYSLKISEEWKIPKWKLINGSAAPLKSPVHSAEPLEALTLIPHRSAKLCISISFAD
jgi:hypothetical protein